MDDNFINDFLYGQTTRAYEYFGSHFTQREIEVEVDVPLKKDPTKTKKATRKRLVDGVVFRLYS
ncbi:MAG: hypothetical protein J6X03_02880, partial [Bacilli bacterium]|nr:hypothetical protein [Bacilli bacterium]